MVKLEDIPVDASVTGTEQVLLNDGNIAKLSTVDNILAKQHNHTASDVTDFNTAVDARVDVLTDTAKTTPVDTDVFALWDTVRKKVTWANIKATLKTYFDTLYQPISSLRTGLSNWKMYHTNGSGVETEITIGAAATVLTSNGASSAPTFQSIPTNFTRVMKTADESATTDTTLSDDSQLTFAMLANTKYSFRAVMHIYQGSAGDFKYRHNGPASPTLLSIHRRAVVPAGTAFSSQAIDTSYSASDITVLGTSDNPSIVLMEGIIHNGANAGNFTISWAQNSSSGTATVVRAGSYIEYTAL